MDARHYAPRARLVVTATSAVAFATASRLAAESASTVGLVVHEPSGAETAAGSRDPRVALRVLPPDPVAYARAFYATLHALDDAGVAAIVVQAVPDGDAWWALADRLRRASALGASE